MTKPLPGYATPSLRKRDSPEGAVWVVHAYPWGGYVGWVQQHPSGWTAHNGDVTHGLFPDRQAAAEVLVKQAGYELEMT
jgi:hypothetical protein